MPQSDGRAAQIVSHGRQTITIGNVPVEVVHQTVDLDLLKLDPDNPRLRYMIRKLGQPATSKLLAELVAREDFFEELLRQIRDNGGVLDAIHVLADGRVVEGNTRLACLLRLRKNQPTDERWQTIPVLRLPEDISPHLVSILQGSFHVQAKNKWKAYAKAEHLHHMRTVDKMSFADIGRILGLQQRVVERLVQQYEMITAEILPKLDGDVRRGIKLWSHVDEFFKRADLEDYRAKPANVKQFANMVVEGKIKGGADVRHLSKSLKSAKAKAALEKDGIKAAVAVMRQSDPTIGSQAFRRISEAASALKSLSVSEVDRLKAEPSAQELCRELYMQLKQAARIAKFKLE